MSDAPALHGAHVMAWAQQVSAVRRVEVWRHAQSHAARAEQARELMRRCAWLLRAGRQLPAAYAEWLAQRLQAAADSGNAGVAFTTNRGRGGSPERWFERLCTAGLVHSVMAWKVTTKTPAATLVGKVINRSKKTVLADYNAAIADWDLSGPFVATIGDPKDPDSYSIDRSQPATYHADVLGRRDWVAVARNRASGSEVVCALTPHRDSMSRHFDRR